MLRLCDAANFDSYAHVCDEVLRCLIVCMEEPGRDHYMFLRAALAKCERCLAFWLHHGADLNRGAASHPDWVALEWARASNAGPEILQLLTPSVWPSLRPAAFCVALELDMYVHVPGKIRRREVSQMSPRVRNHHLFLRAALFSARNLLAYARRGPVLGARLHVLVEHLRSTPRCFFTEQIIPAT